MSLIIIGVTPPYFFDGEADRITHLLSTGEVNFIHIRKPESDIEKIEALIRDIDSSLHPLIKLHDHFELIERYDIGGVHLNNRNMKPPVNAKSVSISLHSLEQIDKNKDKDYFFISPVFDSISKPGYKSAFNQDELSKKIKGEKAIALGGVTPEKFPLLKSLGFYGAAMLGYFFPTPNIKNRILAFT